MPATRAETINADLLAFIQIGREFNPRGAPLQSPMIASEGSTPGRLKP